MFPLVPGGKEPAQDFTDNLRRASNNRKQVETWARLYPGCNWGLSLAESSVIVIDVDVKPGKVGVTSVTIIAALPMDTPDIIACAIHYLTKDAPPSIEGRHGEFTLLMVAAVLKDMGVSYQT